jgi:DNA-binding transcriptional LysR family regulator
MTSPERLKGIDAFVATADSGGFTAAAARLKITNSAVSKAVARLEQRLGTRLFHRTTRSLSLTDAGAVYYRTCTKILSELEEAEAMMASEKAAPIGRLRIDLPASYGRLRVLPLLLQFAKTYPGIRPQISFSDHFVDLIEEEIDVVVRIGGQTVWPSSLGHRSLGAEKVIFCASPDYLSRRGAPQNLSDLDHHDRIVYTRPGSPASWMFGDAGDGAEAGDGRKTGDAPATRRFVEGHMALGNAEAVAAAALAGCGIAQLPTWLVGGHLHSGEIIELLPGHSTSGLPFSLIWPKSKQRLPKVALLIELLGGALNAAE